MGRIIAMATTALLLVIACSSDNDPSTPTPTATESGSIRANDYLFEGIVRNFEYACHVDGMCSVTVEVVESLGGGVLAGGAQVRILEAIGEGFPACYGRWEQLEPGVRVIVRAHEGVHGYDLAICTSRQYFVIPIDVTPNDTDAPISSPTEPVDARP